MALGNNMWIRHIKHSFAELVVLIVLVWASEEGQKRERKKKNLIVEIYQTNRYENQAIDMETKESEPGANVWAEH